MRDGLDDVELRSATVDDAVGIAHVYVETWRATYPGMVPEKTLSRLSVSTLTEVWKKGITEGETVMVASSGARVVGFSSAGRERFLNPFFRCEVFTLYVSPAAQGHGIGSMLLLEMLRRLHGPVVVWVLADNAGARRFYEALGGVPVRRRRERVGGAWLEEVAYAYFDVG